MRQERREGTDGGSTPFWAIYDRRSSLGYGMSHFFSVGWKSVAAAALSDSGVAEGWVGKSMAAGKATLAPGQQSLANTQK